MMKKKETRMRWRLMRWKASRNERWDFDAILRKSSVADCLCRRKASMREKQRKRGRHGRSQRRKRKSDKKERHDCDVVSEHFFLVFFTPLFALYAVCLCSCMIVVFLIAYFSDFGCPSREFWR